MEREVRTLLFPATKQQLSEARLTERMGMSPAGVWGRDDEKVQRRFRKHGGKGGCDMQTYELMSASVLR